MARSFGGVLFCVGIAVVSLAGPAAAQTRTWGASGLYGEIVAVDCADCGEDLGLIVACQGLGGNALISVPFAAVDPRPSAPTNAIDFVIDGKVFGFEAETVENGLVGFVPQFLVRPNHPLIAALQSGQRADVRFAGSEARIGLRNSRGTLEIFKAHCAWNGIPFDPNAPAVPVATDVAAPLAEPGDGGAPVPAFEGPHWFTLEHVDEGGKAMISLLYGIPETDAVLFSSRCAAKAGTRSATVDLMVDFGAAAPGDAVDAIFRTGAQTYTYPAQVFEDGSEYAGVRVEIGSRAPLWAALASAADVRIGVDGAGLASATADGAATAIEDFTSACFAEAAVPKPLIELEVPAGPPLPLSPDSPAPLVTLKLGTANDPNAEKVPLITLDPGPAVAPLVAMPVGTRYLCDDGSALTVAFETAGAAKVARLATATGGTLALAQVPSSFGEKYSDGSMTLRISSGTLQVVQGSGRQFCTQQ